MNSQNTTTGSDRARRLAAVISADIADYASHMAVDDVSTTQNGRRSRAEIIEPAMVAFSGRLVKHTGDGFLAEFVSAADAVRCAIDIQEKQAGFNAGIDSDRQLIYRLGINLGDILSDDEDIYGDGVNIAARIRALATAGDILLSSAIHDQVRSNSDFDLQNFGDHELKNIARPVTVWRVDLANNSASASVHQEVPPATPFGAHPVKAAPVDDRPSVAVLPFENMSGDSEQEYFADGISEDLITDLSKISGLHVIARNSVFTFKGKAVNVPDVARDLGVAWVMEGSVRKSGNRVRVTAQLIDGSTGGHLWAERYDRNLDDIFAVQDEITAEIVKALKVKLSQADQERVARRMRSDVETYDLYLKAREKLFSGAPDEVRDSIPLFDQILEADPGFTPALAGRGMSMMALYTNQWTDDPEAALKEAVRCAEAAMAQDDQDPAALLSMGIICMLQCRYDEASRHGHKLLELLPNKTEGFVLLGNVALACGDPEEAIRQLEAGRSVDPMGPDITLHILGQAQYMAGDMAKAEKTFLHRVEVNPQTDSSRLYLASIFGHQERFEEAKKMWESIFQVNPDYSLQDRVAGWPFREDTFPRHIIAGLEKAGIDHQISFE
jgi:adenylate cyclase